MHNFCRKFLQLVQQFLNWKNSTKALIMILYFFVILSTSIDTAKRMIKTIRVNHPKPANKVNRIAVLVRYGYHVIFVGIFLLLFVIKQKKIRRIIASTMNFKRNLNNQSQSFTDYLCRHIIAWINIINFLAVVWSVSKYFLWTWKGYKFYQYYKEVLRISVTLSTQLLATIYYSIIVVVTEHVEGLTMDVKAFTGKGKWLRFASFTRNRTQCSALREISPHWEEQVVPLHKSSKSVCKLVHLQSTSKNSKHKSNTKEQHFETNYLPMHKAFDMNSGVEDLDEITAEVRRLQKFQLSFNSLFAYPVSAILLVCMCTVVTRIFDIAISWRYKDLIGGSIDVLYSCSLLVILTCTPEFLLAGRSELQGSVLDLKFLVRKAAASARHPRCYDRVSAAVEELGCLLDKFPQFSMRNLFTIGRGTLVQMWSFIATYVVILLQFQTTFEDDINVRKLWKLRRKRC